MTFDPIAIIGAGAVGAYYGARLAQAGADVHFFTRSDCAPIRAHGLRVQSFVGDFTLDSVNVYDDTAAMPKSKLIIVSLKATAQADYVRLVRPVVREDSIILCLQNGLGNEQILADAFGADRVLGAIAYTCINRVGPGEIAHTAHGKLRIGEFGSHSVTRAEQIAEMWRRAKVPADAVSDLRRFRWHKLVWNIPFNGWGAAMDLHTEALLATPTGAQLVRDTMQEVVDAAAALGMTFEPDLIDDQIAKTREMAAYQSSMQLDRQQQRGMEIDAIITEPLRQAERAGVRVPLIRTLDRLLRAIPSRG